MAIEEFDDVAEDMADKLGVYGEERSAWVSEFKQRVRKALEIERLIRANEGGGNWESHAAEVQMKKEHQCKTLDEISKCPVCSIP